MKPPHHGPELTIGDLARRVGGRVRGDATRIVRGVAAIDDATPHDMTWAVDETHARRLANCAAAGVVGPESLTESPMPAILVADVEAAIADILGLFQPPHWRPDIGIHPTACVDPTAEIAADARIGALCIIGPRARVGPQTVLHGLCSIGADVQIGEACEIWPNAVIGDRCILGNRVILWPGAVIGRDGFGFIFRKGRHRRIPQIGHVIIEDGVEIGANSCIDRAKCGATRVAAGTKIDNLVQVAHNVRVGPHCILAGQAGLSGSVRLGTGVILGGQVGVSDGLNIGDGTQVTAQSGVTKSLPPGMVADSRPARPRMETLREQAAVRRLPALLEQIRELNRRVRDLEAAADDRQTR